MDNISDRLRTLVKAMTSDTRRHKEMEAATNLPANLWKAWWHEKQRPNEDMIQSVARAWPWYAFWLVTGYSDPEYGQGCPIGLGFPNQGDSQASSRAYFAAVGEYYKEATQVARYWFKLRFEEELTDDVSIPDRVLRALTDMGLPEEATAKLRQRKLEVERAFLLRRAEILINVEMPKIRYEETPELIETIRSLIIRSGHPAPEMEEKIAREIERLERYTDSTKKSGS